MTNIMTGFRVTEVYPINRNALREPEDMPTKQSLAAKTGLSYISLFSRRQSVPVEYTP